MAPLPPWRRSLQPASFRGVGFKIDVDAKAGGRREVTHEFPKRDIPYAEDMGRRARRFTVTGYLISGPNTVDYRVDRDALIAALESEGAGLLKHPTMGTDLVQPGPYTVSERRERGGYAEVEMSFTEAGQAPSSSIGTDTQGAVTAAAQSAIQGFQGSNDIGNIASGP